MGLVHLLDNHGRLPAYAWPGGYPIYYVMQGDVLCSNCATPEVALIDAHGANWEDPDLYCEDCGERIESAYAEDEHTEGANQ